MQKTFTFYRDQPEENGFYLVRLKKKKYKLYREYDIDFFDLKLGWRKWDEKEIDYWAKLN